MPLKERSFGEVRTGEDHVDVIHHLVEDLHVVFERYYQITRDGNTGSQRISRFTIALR